MVNFDAYTASIAGADPKDVLGLVFGSHKVGWDIKQSQLKGIWSDVVSFRDESGAEVASVLWGGQNQGWVKLEAKGHVTPELVSAVRKEYPQHNCTRVDSAYDIEREGAWNDILAEVLAVKAKYRLKGRRFGDWEDFPEDGRTQYLGAVQSAVQVRLYEKGRQPEYRETGHPDWVRLEIQVRPQKDAKVVYSTLDSMQVWGASAYTRELAARVMRSELDSFPAGTVHRSPSSERALNALCDQYGSILMALSDDVGGWELVGMNLRDRIAARRRSK
jgi:DNA relaxase NicK